MEDNGKSYMTHWMGTMSVMLSYLTIPHPHKYKIAVLTLKVLHHSTPLYLGPPVAIADLPSWWALRSASTSHLVIPLIKLSAVGSRTFPVAVARVWNGLPEPSLLIATGKSYRWRCFGYIWPIVLCTTIDLQWIWKPFTYGKLFQMWFFTLCSPSTIAEFFSTKVRLCLIFCSFITVDW